MAEAKIITVEYVDWDYSDDFYGKVVARSDVRNMTPEEIAVEVAEMREILGNHHTVRMIEEIPAIR